MILGALRATNVSRYKENELTRDHTRENVKRYGAEIFTDSEGRLI